MSGSRTGRLRLRRVTLWQFTRGRWNNRVATCCNGGISVNPFNGNQIVSVTPKLLYVSTNGGHHSRATRRGSPRLKRLAGLDGFPHVANGWKRFFRSGSERSNLVHRGPGRILHADASGRRFNWTSNVLGIETLIALSGLAVHSAYHPVFGAQDEAGCQINVLTNATSPPSSCIPLAASKPLSYFHNLYVPPADPSFMVGKANYNFIHRNIPGIQRMVLTEATCHSTHGTPRFQLAPAAHSPK